MTILELLPSGRPQRQASVRALPDPGGPLLPYAAPHDARLQFQLIRMIDGILDDPDLDLDVYVSLLRHLAQHPGQLAQAVLAHLRTVHTPADLPPYKRSGKARKRPNET